LVMDARVAQRLLGGARSTIHPPQQYRVKQ
jgi:hypothetical protein